MGDGSKRRDRVVAKGAVASSMFSDALETISLKLGRAVSPIDDESTHLEHLIKGGVSQVKRSYLI